MGFEIINDVKDSPHVVWCSLHKVSECSTRTVRQNKNSTILLRHQFA